MTGTFLCQSVGCVNIKALPIKWLWLDLGYVYGKAFITLNSFDHMAVDYVKKLIKNAGFALNAKHF